MHTGAFGQLARVRFNAAALSMMLGTQWLPAALDLVDVQCSRPPSGYAGIGEGGGGQELTALRNSGARFVNRQATADSATQAGGHPPGSQAGIQGGDLLALDS
jgi:hypothetical protein